MFAGDVDAPLLEDPTLIKMKIKSKIQDCYSKIGEVPGVLVDKIGRQKILQGLGHQASLVKPAEQGTENSKGQEEESKKKAEEISMVTQ